MALKAWFVSKFKISSGAWRYYYGFFDGQHGKMVWATLIAAAQTLVIVPSLLLIKYVFDQVIPRNDIRMLIWVGLAILGLRLIHSVIAVWQRRIQIRVINHSIFVLRNQLLNHLYNLSHLFYVRSDLRTLHTRIVQDTERLSNMSTAILSRLLPSLIIGGGLLVICFMLSWYLVLIIIALIPLLYFANRITSRWINKKVFVFQRAFEEFSKGIYFVLRYMPLTTIQSAQPQELDRQKAILKDLQQKTGQMGDTFSVNLQIQETLTGLTAIMIVIVGGVSVALNRMSLGDLLSFYLAAMYLNRHVNVITTSIPDIIAGNVSLNTLFSLASETNNSAYQGDLKILFTGEIELRNVVFAYDRKPVLQGVNLHIPKGCRVAILGDNGTGKTTILHLITALLQPGEGEVLASGVPYSKIDIRSLRRQMGVVAQHPPLFPGTIRENITYGSDSVDEERLRHVCELALALPFIENLQDTFDTWLGDEGVLLSGGEGQRIAIARALYHQPELLILDEPTNHLDHHAVEMIVKNVADMNPGPSVLIISHVPGVTDFADHVYHLQEGVLIRKK